VGHRDHLLSQGAASKTKLPHLTRGEADQTAAVEGKHSNQLGKSIALTTLHDLANLPHLTISIKLVDRRQNTTYKPITFETTSELLLMCPYQDWLPDE
jgi:hypothetical protein